MEVHYFRGHIPISAQRSTSKMMEIKWNKIQDFADFEWIGDKRDIFAFFANPGVTHRCTNLQTYLPNKIVRYRCGVDEILDIVSFYTKWVSLSLCHSCRIISYNLFPSVLWSRTDFDPNLDPDLVFYQTTDPDPDLYHTNHDPCGGCGSGPWSNFAVTKI